MKGKLLFLCQNLPFPPDGGAMIRSYHTLRLLARQYEVTALCFYRRALKPTPEAVREGVAGLAELGEVHAFPIPQDGHPPRLALDHARSLVGRRPYTRWVYDSPAARRMVRELTAAHRFEVVHLDSLDLTAFLPDLPPVPWVCAHHNVESQLLRRRSEAEDGLRQAYIRHQAALMEREERRFCGHFALNLVVSPEDAKVLSGVAPDGEYLVVPNGVDTRSFTPAAPENPRQGIVFVGGQTWFPNRDGMEYFARSILPLIRAERPEVEVTWVGRAGEEEVRRYAEMGVRMTGYVDDIRPYVHRGACFIVPLRVGGGTRLKILDAWALGKAVVSTSPGCEGLQVVEGENMLVADQPETFARAVLRTLDSDDLRRRLEAGGRRTAVEVYDWDVIGQTMLGAYRELE
jgi:glycosyltransferase involved in cell wall biosynthesis